MKRSHLIILVLFFHSVNIRLLICDFFWSSCSTPVFWGSVAPGEACTLMVVSKHSQSRAQPWLLHSSDESYHLNKGTGGNTVIQVKMQYSEESKTLFCLGFGWGVLLLLFCFVLFCFCIETLWSS